MCRIILVRGIPGSGKTTIAKEFKGFTHLESDMFFEKNGIYAYDHLKIKQAHDWCISSAKNALDRGERVVVSNTFIRLYELKRYIDFGYSFGIIEANGNYQSTHYVPQEKIAIMKDKWEWLPAEWEKRRLQVDSYREISLEVL